MLSFFLSKLPRSLSYDTGFGCFGKTMTKTICNVIADSGIMIGFKCPRNQILTIGIVQLCTYGVLFADGRSGSLLSGFRQRVFNCIGLQSGYSRLPSDQNNGVGLHHLSEPNK
jgi:hypothetical protein